MEVSVLASLLILAESVVFVVPVLGADVVLGAVVAVFGLLTGFGAEVFAGVLGRDTDELFATAMIIISCYISLNGY